MAPQRILYISLFLFSGFFSNCRNNPEPRYVNSKVADDFIRQVPLIQEGILQGQEALFYEELKREAFALQLDSLETGYDSLQYRIWLGHSLAKVRHVVILKLKNKKWAGQLVSFSKESPYTDAGKNVRNIHPLSGWDTLVDNLNKLKIASLPHESEVTGYRGEGGADGIAYYFEIATLKNYRVYSYSNPGENAGFWQAGNVLQIANLLEKEFEFQYIK